jgi:hypothetical protein
VTDKEIYDALRMIIRTYISEELHNGLLALLEEREIKGEYLPGKGILAAVNSDSNGVALKEEHHKLWKELCFHCV